MLFQPIPSLARLSLYINVCVHMISYMIYSCGLSLEGSIYSSCTPYFLEKLASVGVI